MIAYPDCSGCGHNASGIVGGTDTGRCSSFVAYPPGDRRGLAGYCDHLCAVDPVIRAWLGQEPLSTVRAQRARDQKPVRPPSE